MSESRLRNATFSNVNVVIITEREMFLKKGILIFEKERFLKEVAKNDAIFEVKSIPLSWTNSWL